MLTKTTFQINLFYNQLQIIDPLKQEKHENLYDAFQWSCLYLILIIDDELLYELDRNIL